MEGALIGRTLAGRLGRLAVAAKISVPLAVLLVKEELFAIFKCVEKYRKIFFISRFLIEHKGRNKQLVVRPPELHIVLVSLRRNTERIHEIKQTAVFLVPACRIRPIEDLLATLDKLTVARALCLLKQEPHALDIVTGVNYSSLGKIKSCLAVSANVFKQTGKLGVNVIFEDVGSTLGGAALVKFLVFGICAKHYRGHIKADHRITE